MVIITEKMWKRCCGTLKGKVYKGFEEALDDKVHKLGSLRCEEALDDKVHKLGSLTNFMKLS